MHLRGVTQGVSASYQLLSAPLSLCKALFFMLSKYSCCDTASTEARISSSSQSLRPGRRNPRDQNGQDWPHQPFDSLWSAAVLLLPSLPNLLHTAALIRFLYSSPHPKHSSVCCLACNTKAPKGLQKCHFHTTMSVPTNIAHW